MYYMVEQHPWSTVIMILTVKWHSLMLRGVSEVFFQPPKKHLPLINREVGPPKRTKSEANNTPLLFLKKIFVQKYYKLLGSIITPNNCFPRITKKYWVEQLFCHFSLLKDSLSNGLMFNPKLIHYYT